MADTPPTSDAVFRIVINAPIERIWRELTKTDEAQGALFNAWLHSTGLSPGERIQMRTRSGRHVIVDGEIETFDPPHRYVHTHRFTQYDDPVCRVSYELKPIEGGVEVTLRVLDLQPSTRTSKDMRAGGAGILSALKSIAETGKPRMRTRLLYFMFDRMEFVLPKRTRSELWPMKPPRQTEQGTVQDA